MTRCYGISLFQLFPERVGGAGEYVVQIVPRMAQRLRPDETLALIGSPRNLEPFADVKAGNLLRIPVRIPRGAVQLLRGLDLLGLRASTPLGWIASRRLRQRTGRRTFDALLFPQQSVFPFGLAGPAAVTILDLLHENFPANFSAGALWLRRRKDRLCLARGACWICISESARLDFLARTHCPADRVHAIPLGGSYFQPAAGNEAPHGARPGVPYLLYPAHAWPHKNHLACLAAWRRFRAAHPDAPARLIFTGQSNRALDRAVRQTPDAEHRGYVARAELARLYAAAHCVVLPTRFEGFGIPLIEALQAGRPVMAADLPVFREIAGDAVPYFDSASPASLEAALTTAVLAPPAPPAPAAVARILGRFHWDRCAQETLEVLRGLAVARA